MKARTRTSVVCVHNDKLLCFKAVDPHDQREFLFLPGGAIEADETAPEAAERETMEETGFEVTIVPHLNVDREYEFFWNNETYKTLTLFYRGYLKSPFQSPKAVNDAPYHKGVVWLPVEDIPKSFNYTAEILSAITELIEDPKLSFIE